MAELIGVFENLVLMLFIGWGAFALALAPFVYKEFKDKEEDNEEER